MFDETYAQRDGIITRCERPTYQPSTPEELILTGPLFQIGAPWIKSSNTVCTTQRAYSEVDLTEISNSFLPRAVYRPGNSQSSMVQFYEAIEEWPKPKIPGFWPIAEDERDIWEAICGEPLIMHQIDTSSPGAETAQQFAFFSCADGEITEAAKWVSRYGLHPHTAEYLKKFHGIRLVQGHPNPAQMGENTEAANIIFSTCTQAAMPDRKREIFVFYNYCARGNSYPSGHKPFIRR